MLSRKIQSKKRYLLSFLIGTFLFLLLISVSYFFVFLELGKISRMQGETAYSLFEKKLSLTYFEENFCRDYNLRDISESLAYQGLILSDAEEKFGKGDKDVLFQKRFYSILLLEHLDFVEMYNDACDSAVNTIVFFYSNEENFVEESEYFGKVLDLAYAKNDDLFIYSFDVNLDSEIISKMKNKFDVAKVPVVIVNGEHVITELDNISELEVFFE